jgi:hypothetical protein
MAAIAKHGASGLLLAMLVSLAHAVPDDGVRQEVQHLLNFLGESDCNFYRNGKWHDAGRDDGVPGSRLAPR